MNRKPALRVLVMGLGLNRGGVSVARYFARQGAALTVTDLKTPRELAPSLRELRRYRGITYVLGRHRLADFTRQDLVFQNPAVPADSLYLAHARRRGVTVTNEAAYFLRHCRARVIGVTGTRGKSTVSALIFRMLSMHGRRNVFLAGNIATRGLLDVLDAAQPRDIVVAELSSWHLEHVSPASGSPQISVVTNIFPDHLNRYRSITAYARAKERIVRYQKPTDCAVLNYDDARVRAFAKHTRGSVWYFSQRTKVRGAYRFGTTYRVSDGRRSRIVIDAGEVSPHLPYHENVLAAAAAAFRAGVSAEHMRKAIAGFRGLPFRMQVIARFGPLTVINDSCATAPIATERALESLRGRLVLIAGGVDKSLPVDSLAKTISGRVDALILLPGTASDKLYRSLVRLRYGPMRRVKNLRSAVLQARRVCSGASYLLFSPAAASFNLFVNEFDRGRQFSKITHEIFAKNKK